jgi:hypothetical protein
VSEARPTAAARFGRLLGRVFRYMMDCGSKLQLHVNVQYDQLACLIFHQRSSHTAMKFHSLTPPTRQHSWSLQQTRVLLVKRGATCSDIPLQNNNHFIMHSFKGNRVPCLHHTTIVCQLHRKCFNAKLFPYESFLSTFGNSTTVCHVARPSLMAQNRGQNSRWRPRFCSCPILRRRN